MALGVLCFPLPVVVGRLGSPSTDIAKLSGVGGINQLEQRCGEAKITKTWSHVLSKVSSPFGNAALGQAPALVLLVCSIVKLCKLSFRF